MATSSRRSFDPAGDFASMPLSRPAMVLPGRSTTCEYLDLGAGTDFDTKIVIKPKAPELLRETFDKPSWRGELIMFSGVTDCYQPVEKELELTKQCLNVCLEYCNPVSII